MAKRQKDAQARLKSLRTELNRKFLERRDVIDAMLAALLCPGPVGFFMIGPPGTGKTAMAEAIASAVDWRTQYVLFNSQSTLEDAIGPVDILGLTPEGGGKYQRRLERGVCGNEVFIADEVFKCNASTLNAMLGPLADAQYSNGDAGTSPVPLELFIGASNEVGQEEGLEAFMDRLALRFECGYVSEKNLGKLMQREIEGSWPSVDTVLSAEDITELRAIAASLSVDAEIGSAITELAHAARTKFGVVFSDRRAIRTIGLLRAYAVITGQPTVNVKSLGIMKGMLWDEPSQIREAKQLVGNYKSQAEKNLAKIKDALEGVEQQIPELQRRSKQKTSPAEAGAITSEVYALMGNISQIQKSIDEQGQRVKASVSPEEWADAERRLSALDQALGRLSRTTANTDLGVASIF